jgi:hypothetical protein
MEPFARPYRRVLMAIAASAAALAGSLLGPAWASAQPAGTPVTRTITLALSPATVDYGHRNVTASGAVTTSAGPVVGAAVTVSYVDVDGQSAQISLITGNDGSYSGIMLSPETAAQQVTASVAATSSTAAGSASEQLGFTQDAVTITASFAQPYVNAYSTDTLSGVASYISGGSPHPLANSAILVTSPGNDGLPVISATVTTAADGSFRYVTPQVGDIGGGPGSAGFTVSSAATPYLEAGQQSITLLINEVAQIFDFSGTLTANRVLRLFACGGMPAELSDGLLLGPLDYQYSRTPHGPWKTLGTGQLDITGPCQSEVGLGDGTYPGKFTAPRANAYYRAYAPAMPGQMSAVSQVIHLWKYSTRISGFTITRRSVSRNGKVAVSGRLRRLTGKWAPDARQRMVIEFRYNNKTYILGHRLMTDSAGRFHGTFAVPRTSEWLAVYEGGRNQFATASNAVTIRVR